MVSGRSAPFSYSPCVYCSAALIRLSVPPQFADWCMNYGKHGCRTPDTPFSLFEGKMSHSQKSWLSGHGVTIGFVFPGMAGTIYFLADLLQPAKARFPAFEV